MGESMAWKMWRGTFQVLEYTTLYILHHKMYSWKYEHWFFWILLCGQWTWEGTFLSVSPDLHPGFRLNISLHKLPNRLFPWNSDLVLPSNLQSSHKVLAKSLTLFFKSLLWPAQLSCDLAPAYLIKFNWGHSVLPSSYAGFQSVSKIPQAPFSSLPFPLPEMFLPSSLHVQVGLIPQISAQIQLFREVFPEY